MNYKTIALRNKITCDVSWTSFDNISRVKSVGEIINSNPCHKSIRFKNKSNTSIFDKIFLASKKSGSEMIFHFF